MAGNVIETVKWYENVRNSQAVEWSEDNRIVVTCERRVFIMNLSSGMTTNNQAKILSHQFKITLPDQNEDFDVGIKVKDVLDKLTYRDKYQIILDHSITPDLTGPESIEGYKSAKWSPKGVDSNSRCILATLTVCGKLGLFCTKRSGALYKVSDLTGALYKYIKETGFSLVDDVIQNGSKVSELIEVERLRLRKYALVVTAIDWSPVYDSQVPHTSPPKSKKARKDPRAVQKYAILTTVTKIGHCVLWKIQTPFCRSDQASIAQLFYTNTQLSTAVLWCDVERSSGFLVIGYFCGIIKAFSVNMHRDQIVKTETETLIWKEEDNIGVSHFVWLKETHTLLVCKGPYLMAFKIKTTQDAIGVERSCHFCGSNNLEITGVSVRNDKITVCSLDGYLFNLTIQDTNKEFAIHLVDGFTSDDTKKFNLHGMASSENQVITVCLKSPSRNLDPRLKETLQLQVSSVKTMEQVLELSLNPSSTTDPSVFDCTCFLNHACSKDLLSTRLSKHFDSDWKKLPMSTIKVSRALLIILINKLKNQNMVADLPTNVCEFIKKRQELEEHIVHGHIITWLEKAQEMDKVCEKGLQTLKLMSQWLQRKNLNATADQTLVSAVAKKHGYHGDEKPSEEKCFCGESVPFETILTGQCPSGHNLSRCCLTLQLITTSFRTCIGCHCVAITKSDTDSPFTQQLLDSRCSLCNDFLV